MLELYNNVTVNAIKTILIFKLKLLSLKVFYAKMNKHLQKKKEVTLMLGVLINVCTVIIGSTMGLLFKKSISKKYSDAVMTGIGLCVILIGIQGMLKGENVLISIFSMVIGVLIGTALDIDGKLNGAGEWLSKKIKTKDSGKSSLAEGFVTASLVFCIGAMTILGSLDAGLKGDNTTLITKSILDLFSSMMLSASLGIGVIFAAAFVFIFQGGIVLTAGVLEPFLDSFTIGEITCVGSIMIMALGLNLAGISKIKVANFFPALILVVPMCYLFDFLGQFIPALG